MKAVKKSTEKVDNSKKIHLNQLGGILQELRRLPQKNPLAWEISRAIKSVSTSLSTFEEQREALMHKYLLKDEEGNWVLKDEVQKELEKNKQLQPTIFGYVVEKGEDEAYKEEMLELMGSECTGLNITGVKVSSRSVKVNGKAEPLIDHMSEYFETAQIIFLEEIGIILD